MFASMHTVSVLKACVMSDNMTNGARKLNVCDSCLIVHDSQPWTVSDEVCIVNVALQNSVCDSCRVRRCYDGPTFRNPVRHLYEDYLIFLISYRIRFGKSECVWLSTYRTRFIIMNCLWCARHRKSPVPGICLESSRAWNFPGFR